MVNLFQGQPCMPTPWHYLWWGFRSFAVPFFPPHFCFPITLMKVRLCLICPLNCSRILKAHLSAFLQTLIWPFYVWCWSEVCIFCVASVIILSKSPVNGRLWDHFSFLEIGDFTDTYFRVLFHSFYDLSVISCCCFSSADLWCVFQSQYDHGCKFRRYQ